MYSMLNTISEQLNFYCENHDVSGKRGFIRYVLKNEGIESCILVACLLPVIALAVLLQYEAFAHMHL